jgi:SAM-dependent methyltransferase
MSFAVSPDSYDLYMGRYSRRLAPLLADFASVPYGQRVLEVGCGPGALTLELAGRIGADHVAAVDPSTAFALACAERVPEADVRTAPAEELPWPDGGFDAVLSQLVVSFLRDPDAGVAEMRRVLRAKGLLVACTWDCGMGWRCCGRSGTLHSRLTPPLLMRLVRLTTAIRPRCAKNAFAGSAPRDNPSRSRPAHGRFVARLSRRPSP